MKIFSFMVALMLLSLSGSGQNCTYNYDYSNSTGWIRMDVLPSGAPFTGTPRINIASGTVNFNSAPDGNNEIRVFRSLGSPLCESWVAEFDFRITAAGSGLDQRTIGHFLLSLTENNQNPMESFNGNRTDNDAISVLVSDGNGAGVSDMTLKVSLKDGTVPVNVCVGSVISLNTNYHVILERIEGTAGQITLINADTDTEVDNCCFTIPETINNLSFLQHSNGPQGDVDRVMTGTIDNTCVRDCHRIEDCCLDKEITGPSVICNSDEFSVLPTYSVTNSPGTAYNWSVPEGVTFNGQGTNSITITNASSLSGTIVITLEMTCGCITTTLTKTVIIYDDLSSQTPFSYTVTNNPTTNDISVTSNITVTGVTHYWQIYQAADCLNTNKLILNENNNPVGLTTAGTGTNFNVTGLDNSLCYIIQHIVSYNGACEVEFRAKVYASGAESEGTEAEYYTGEGESSFKKNTINSVHSDKLTVYPNPGFGEFNIEVKDVEKFSYSVYEISGKLIQEGQSEQSQMKLDLKDCNTGVYIFRIKTDSGKSYSTRLSKTE